MEKHVLIVEDDPFILELGVNQLKAAGYKVSALTDGEAAASFLEANQVDVLVVDQDLPHMKGTEILALPPLAQLPAVLYTNSAVPPEGFVDAPHRKHLFKAITTGDELIDALTAVQAGV